MLDGGAAGVALVGPVDIRAVVSQGCRPVGSPFAVTRGEGNIVHELGGRPAVDRLRQLLASLDQHEQELLRGGGLQVGQVIDEHKASFDRGDFLVRACSGPTRRPARSPSGTASRSARPCSSTSATPPPPTRTSSCC